MKKLVLALVVIAGLYACNKQEAVAPLSEVSVNEQAKKDNRPLAVDYVIKIKKIKNTKNEYQVTLKIKELVINGKDFTNDKNTVLKGVVFGLNNTKKDPDVPIDAILESTEMKPLNSNGNSVTYTASFNNPLNVEPTHFNNVVAALTIHIDGGNLNIKDYSNMKFENSSLTVNGGNLEFRDQSTVSFDVSGIKAEK